MTPSAIRTLALPEYEGQTVGLSWPLIWPPKDPLSVDLDYSLDISGWLLEIQDVIGALNVHWGPYTGSGDLAIGSLNASNGIITVFTSAGRPYSLYTVTISAVGHITGMNLVRSILLPVNAVGAAADVTAGMGVSGVFA